MHSDRPEVGIYSERLPQTEQPLLRSLPCAGIVPTWTPDRAQENRIGPSAKLERFGG
jgi:hypothetical protein